MDRDPFYRQILERLSGPLDPDLFEQCAADLLRSAYPGLVPVKGGDDAGMDGAIPDGLGEPYPLITTTGRDVIGNLRRNLRSYAARGHPSRKVVLATSQALTPRRRENLFTAAREAGFVLLQIHERASFADMLYRNAGWCRDLLGLAGDPPPLSTVPRSSRPILTTTLVGREKDIEWIDGIRGDRLLVGQPGCGKTFLLSQIVKDGHALFVVSRDRSALAAGIREQMPTTLIVDDVFPDDEIIADLLYLRKFMGASFDIVAVCWPSFEAEIADAMQMPPGQVHRLDLLTKDEMATLVREASPDLANWLVQEIVDQAAGLPGLAVTLAYLCSVGDARSVATGDALLQHVRLVLEKLTGEPAVEILSVLSLAGDSGLTLSCLAAALDQKEIAVRRNVVGTAAAGVVRQMDDGRLSVRPHRLRHALVRDVFYGDLSLSIESYRPHIQSTTDLALTLIGAKGCGAKLADAELWSFVREAGTDMALEAYARLGPEECRRVAQHAGRVSPEVARAALTHIPKEIIPTLLDLARHDDRPLHSYPDAPLRIIDDWVKDAFPGTGQAVARRRLLLEVLLQWVADREDWKTAVRALTAVLRPDFMTDEPEPGSGLRVTLRWGLLLCDEIREVVSLWATCLPIITEASPEHWRPLVECIAGWANPLSLNATPSPEACEIMRAHARQMAEDSASIASSHPGVLRALADATSELGIATATDVDTEFGTLYPPETQREWREEEREYSAAARDLGRSWAGQNPRAIARRVRRIEGEARLVERLWPRFTPLACESLASAVEQHIPWVHVFLDEELPADTVFPLLLQAIAGGEEGWEDLATEMLADDRYAGAAIEAVLKIPEPPHALLDATAARLMGFERHVRTLALRGEMSEFVVARLLDCAPPSVDAAVALGEWLAEPEGSVRASLREQWRKAIVRHEDDYWLSQVLAAEEELALDWLKLRLSQDGFPFWRYDDTLEAVGKCLSTRAKSALLDELPLHDTTEIVAYYLLKSDPVAYEVLLRNERLKPCHLLPLYGRPEGGWAENALRALDAGYSTTDVAEAAFVGPLMLGVSRFGDESALWQEWIESFTQLGGHQDPRLREVATVGIDIAAERRDRALREERHEAIYGIR